jgi:Glycosyl hydrolase catalytic core
VGSLSLGPGGRCGIGPHSLSRRALLCGLSFASLCLAWDAAPVCAGRPLPARFFAINAIPIPRANDAAVMRRAGIRRARVFFNWSWIQPPHGLLLSGPSTDLVPQCFNFRDDDGDGLVDAADPGCSGPFDDDESDSGAPGGGEGPYRWGDTDTEVERLAERHIRAVPALQSTPSWVAPTTTTPPTVNREGRVGWRMFLKAAVKRYGQRGNFWAENPKLPYEPIRDWQIWNEPNSGATWAPRTSPRAYASLLRISARAIRSLKPRAKIVLGGLAPGLNQRYPSWRFLARLYQDGARPYFDMAALHPYDATVGGVADQIRRVRAVMRRHHDARAPLWITEVGWSSSTIPGRRWAVGSAMRQAALLRGTLRFAVSHARRLHIGAFFWFDWGDVPNWQKGQGFNFGLVDSARNPKPSLRTYRRLARRRGR